MHVLVEGSDGSQVAGCWARVGPVVVCAVFVTNRSGSQFMGQGVVQARHIHAKKVAAQAGPVALTKA